MDYNSDPPNIFIVFFVNLVFHAILLFILDVIETKPRWTICTLCFAKKVRFKLLFCIWLSSPSFFFAVFQSPGLSRLTTHPLARDISGQTTKPSYPYSDFHLNSFFFSYTVPAEGCLPGLTVLCSFLAHSLTVHMIRFICIDVRSSLVDSKVYAYIGSIRKRRKWTATSKQDISKQQTMCLEFIQLDVPIAITTK